MEITTKSPFTVVSDIPLPNVSKGESLQKAYSVNRPRTMPVFPFKEMKRGDSFFVVPSMVNGINFHSIQSRLNKEAERLGYIIATRTLRENGIVVVRVWMRGKI